MSWRLAKSLGTLRVEIRSRWPGTIIWTIGDAAHRTRSSDHNPNSQGVVCAIDVVGAVQAKAVWDLVLSSRDPRVKYAIFNREIISSTVSPWQVRRYTGSNPHLSHCHLSVGRGPSGRSTRPDLYDDESPWFAFAEEDEVASRRGDSGKRVEYVQRRLNDVRSTVSNRFGRLATDGDYGSATANAVAAVQHNYGLRGAEINGDVLDQITWGYLLALSHSVTSSHG